jgi:hypothetical protein
MNTRSPLAVVPSVAGNVGVIATVLAVVVVPAFCPAAALLAL